MQCVANTLFLTLEQVSGRIKSLSVHRCTSMLTGKFFMNILNPHRNLLLYRSKEESLRPIHGVTPRDLILGNESAILDYSTYRDYRDGCRASAR